MQTVGGAPGADRRGKRLVSWPPSVSDESVGSRSRRLSPATAYRIWICLSAAFRKLYEPPAQRLKRRAEEERRDQGAGEGHPINEVIAFSRRLKPPTNSDSRPELGDSGKELANFPAGEAVQNPRERIVINQWDIEAWSVLIRDAQERKLEDGEKIFEEVVAQFPLSAVFQRCLTKECCTSSCGSCTCSTFATPNPSSPRFKRNGGKAYDFALEKMGLDFSSYSIWGSYAESQKITAVRRDLPERPSSLRWCGATTAASQTGLNAALAKKFIEDRQRDYMNASESLRSSRLLPRASNRNWPSTPPTNNPDEARQVEAVEKKDNPLRTDDLSLISKRVMFAYEQCLLCLGHHPDIWYEARLEPMAAKQFADEAASMYDRATQVLKENTLLYFAYADYEEGRGNFEKVHSIYRKLVNVDSIDPDAAVHSVHEVRPPQGGHQVGRAACSSWPARTRTAPTIYSPQPLSHGYVLCYTEYMSHLNEDNNTRVLFERALTSGSVPTEKSRTSVGDLASVLKVERRRLQAFQGVEVFRGKETALLID
uniref:Suf domain-containing protein n=1 Tax=Macrostomum lignano TaxID=282301 RepID=A0A1I8FCY6_9PLAT